jgi:hypothetical protein
VSTAAKLRRTRSELGKEREGRTEEDARTNTPAPPSFYRANTAREYRVK